MLYQGTEKDESVETLCSYRKGTTSLGLTQCQVHNVKSHGVISFSETSLRAHEGLC